MRDKLTTTSLEQVPREFQNNRRKSPVALIIIILIVILFGSFWLYQERMVNTDIEQQPTPITTAPPRETTPPTEEQPSVSAMQEDTVNIAIPDYSSQF